MPPESPWLCLRWFAVGLGRRFGVGLRLLGGWLRRGGALRFAIAGALAALAACSVAVSSFGVFFDKPDLPGLEWRAEPGSESQKLRNSRGAPPPGGREVGVGVVET